MALAGLEHAHRLRPAERPTGPTTGDLRAPAGRGVLHGGQAGEVRPGEEAVAHIRDGPLDLAVGLGFLALAGSISMP
jgi:hypothetical protein